MDMGLQQDIADLKKSDAKTKKDIAVLQRGAEAGRDDGRALHEVYRAELAKIASQLKEAVVEGMAALRKDLANLEIRMLNDSRDREARLMNDSRDREARLMNDFRNRERWIIGTVIATVVAGVAVLGFLQNKGERPPTIIYAYPPAVQSPAPDAGRAAPTPGRQAAEAQ